MLVGVLEEKIICFKKNYDTNSSRNEIEINNIISNVTHGQLMQIMRHKKFKRWQDVSEINQNLKGIIETNI